MAGAFSGIDGFECGFEDAGFEVLWRCEIDRVCNDTMRFNRPELKTYTDVHDLAALAERRQLSIPRVFTFGSPCQDLSVAGKRAGLDGNRSSLFYVAIDAIRRMLPGGLRFAVWENVAGALSSNGGRDFACVLSAFCQLGAMDVSYRILDSQWFGVAQRRRRVFVVADFGGERAGEILSLAEGLQGHPAPCREAGARIAAGITSGSHSSGVSAPGRRREDDENLIPELAATLGGGSGQRGFSANPETCGALVPELSLSLMGKPNDSHNPTMQTYIPVVSHPLSAEGADASEDGTGRGSELVVMPFDSRQVTSPDNRSSCEPGSPCGTLHETGTFAIAFGWNKSPSQTMRVDSDTTDALQASPSSGLAIAFTERRRPGGRNIELSEDVAPCLEASPGRAHRQEVMTPSMQVRRLTPTEWERLQGHPDNWTKYGRKPDGTVYEIADGPRYKMLGNGVTRTVSRWIADRIAAELRRSA